MLTRLLVANRGEIAVRIMRTAADLGVETVAIHPADDGDSLHARSADQVVEIPGAGPAAYLDIAAIIGVAVQAGCDSVHPGYGFLAENADFARACADAGLTFVGPAPETLALFGNKVEARVHAESCGVPVPRGTTGPTTPDMARALMETLGSGSVMIKALAGGGGRGMRPVSDPSELDATFARCESEARAAFGNGELYAEEVLSDARHIEVQIVGDGSGKIVVLGDRDCSVQRQRQKLVEIAPAPALSESTRAQLHEHAQSVAAEAAYRGIGTMEFLVVGGRIAFLEGNARIQVEHTVTEAVFGVDLVAVQLAIAAGQPGVLESLPTAAHGCAVQARINLEQVAPDGAVRPSGGHIATLDLPTGPGVRVDTYATRGYTTNPRYDSLLAKVIAHSPSDDPDVAIRRLSRALSETTVGPMATTLELCTAVLSHPEFGSSAIHTGWLEQNLPQLLAATIASNAVRTEPRGGVGAEIDGSDPLAVLSHGRDALADQERLANTPSEAGQVRAPLQGTVISIDVAVGDEVSAGQQLVVMEAMKMEHVITASIDGVISEIWVEVGTAVFEQHILLSIDGAVISTAARPVTASIDLDATRDDLEEVFRRHGYGLDENRPAAVDKRRRTGQRTARENVDDLLDPDTYIEYGSLVIAAQRKRRTVEDLIENTPADGMVAGIGRVNGELFGEQHSRCVVMSYDYTVLAGTQGGQNHRKKDRLFELAQRWRLPVVFFTEGGGGRPGDTDGLAVAGLDCLAFGLWGGLSGLVPMVGINSGYCFAGNAAILGCCDVIIATENSNIGMGGPAMIEGGGLGVYRPTEIGPMSVQRPNGVVDIAVKDEAEAVAVAKQYLSYFQGSFPEWECGDQRVLRHVIPENRLRIYDIREVVHGMFDTDSVLELRADFGVGVITALARIEGRPAGVIANNPAHLAGAIDSDAADKAARFMQLCDAFDLPIVQLCDTPGFMVGPEAEKTGLVRHVSRMFVTASSVTVPTCTIVLRKGYGLGAQAMASGGFKFPMFTVAWPTGEFGGMGLEGAVKLGYRKELEAVSDPEERTELYEELVERMYRVGKAVSMADHFEIDDVIDPVESRRWIATALNSVPPPEPRQGKKRPMIDTW